MAAPTVLASPAANCCVHHNEGQGRHRYIFVEEDLGHAAAIWVARYLVVFLKRPGGQAQFTDVLQLQTKDAAFDRLRSWIASHLNP